MQPRPKVIDVSAPRISAARIRLLALTAILALSACGAQKASVPVYHDAAAATVEYRAEAAHLDLAPKWNWPAKPIRASYQGDPVRYEVGFGTQAADQYWFCSWASTALGAPAHSSARAEAITQLIGLRNSYYFRVLDPQSVPYLQKELAEAQAGNLGLVRIDVRANCTFN